MATFLNRKGIKDSLIEIFKEAQRELIIIVPYIKLSDHTYSLLLEADSRGIEMTIIYKENKILPAELEKINKLNNVNLFCHPDIHTKCYCNESKMIIGSMNLYEYSEKYNREMAVLLERDDEFDIFDDDAFDDALDEINSIVKSANLEKKSSKTKVNGFQLEILRPEEDVVRLAAKYLNKYFDNKKFTVSSDIEIYCKDFSDNIDVIIDYDTMTGVNLESGEFRIHRASFKLNWNKEMNKKIHYAFKNEFILSNKGIPHFRLFWDTYHSCLTLYRDWKNQPKWNDLTNEQTIKKFKQGISLVAEALKSKERKLR